MKSKETTSILDIAYPEVEKCLSNKSNLLGYKKFISNLIQNPKRQESLFSGIPSMIYYTTVDETNFFNSTGINKKIIKEAINGTYYNEIPNFNPRYAKDPSTVALLCLVRYFYLNTESENNIDLALVNISFSGKFYPSLFSGRFKYSPSPQIMEYVINQLMDAKSDIIKYKSVIKTVQNIAKTWINTYTIEQSRMQEFSDFDVQYLVQQLHTRLSLFLNNIAEKFYDTYEKKNSLLTYDSDNVDDDNYFVADNDSFKINRFVDATMTEITTKNIDPITVKRSSNDLVSEIELYSILESLLNNKNNIPLIKEYITLLCSLYFNNDNTKDITNISFITYSIKPVPNTKDPHQLRKKELLELILINNSSNFAKRRNRKATESAYFKAFNAYFALLIQKISKN